jgi:hypothetical protein
MTRKAILVAASIALALGSSAALAAGKKHGSEATSADPRMEIQAKQKGGWQGWCNLSSSCNGWDEYFKGVAAHKKYAPASMVIPKI